MIISASRRTDIPACYPDWFYQRIKEGFVLARNPVNFHQISKINLSPDVVDGIVFWTKNPAPMMERLDELNAYTYYFQFTLTSYGKDVEPGVPSKSSEVIPAFQRLADRIGPDRVIWRYDPILISQKYTVDYHLEYFHEIAKRLKDHTRKCIISFLDFYRGAASQLKNLELAQADEASERKLAQSLSQIASSFGLALETCAEEIDLSEYGIGHAHCIDAKLFEQLRGQPLRIEKDKNQRPACGCFASIDIGMYDTCRNGCKYCYANHNTAAVKNNAGRHDPASPLLSGEIGPDDVVKERAMKSCLDVQTRLEET
jgi:DNA repair photolyase